MKRSILVVIVVIATLTVAAPASAASPTVAYLDPATGTLIVSAIIGGFAAIGMVIKKFWYQIKSLFTGGSDKSGTSGVEAPPTAQSADRPASSN